MSFESPITRENLNEYLKALAKEFRCLNGTKMPAEIILIGGAAILANYGFREMTYDVDALIIASGAMKDAINNVGVKLNLPRGWLNSDFKRTGSYSDKLPDVSAYYKTFSNVLSVRTVAAEYLIAMKLMSGRQYKYDISDVYGILWEHQKSGTPISRVAIEKAFVTLYGDISKLPEISARVLDKAFENEDYEVLYRQSLEDEKAAHEFLIAFEGKYPLALKKANIDTVLEQMKRKRAETAKIEPRESGIEHVGRKHIAAPKKKPLLARLDEAKVESKNSVESAPISQRKDKNGQEH